MSLTPLTTPPPSRKIQIHSPFLHARLPQMLPLVQYARRSPPQLHSTESEMKTSHIQMSPLLASSTTQTKKMYRRPSHPQHNKQTPPSELSHSEGQELPFLSPMTMPSTGPSLLRHGRDVHPTWVMSSIETLSNKGLGFLSTKANSEEDFDSY